MKNFKQLPLSIVALLVAALAVWAQQDITGTWQGMLQAGRDLRTVVKVSRIDAELKAVVYSIDQSGAALPASGVTFQGSTLRFTVPGVGATYEGKLSADGKSIEVTEITNLKPKKEDD